MNPKLKMQPTKIILKAQLVQNRPKWIEWIEVEQMNRIGSNRLKWNEMDRSSSNGPKWTEILC